MNITVRNCLLLKVSSGIVVLVQSISVEDPQIINENCEFDFHFNKTDIKPTVLDGEYQVILANWPSYQKMMCSYNNNILISIPSHPYVLMNRSILCNCDIEAESNFL